MNASIYAAIAVLLLCGCRAKQPQGKTLCDHLHDIGCDQGPNCQAAVDGAGVNGFDFKIGCLADAGSADAAASCGSVRCN